ncbi:MAG TPA: glycosyltransferase [Terriglobales bacterium]|nr:glycosyltransferase [Terriglobales bacterium]
MKCKTLHTRRASGKTHQPHILFVIDELCEMGGAERALLKMIRLMPSQDFRCSLLTFRMRGELEELKTLPCPVHLLPLKKTYDWNALKAANQIRRRIRDEKISIVHTFFETSDLWAGPIAKLSGCPILISSRRDMGILRSGKHWRAYKLTGRFYDKVLAVSPQVKEFCIRQDRLDPEKVEVLFNGLEMEEVKKAAGREATRLKMGISQHTPVITTVANIRKVKGIDVLVKAASLVCKKHRDALFLVIGRKSEEEYCRELDDLISAFGLGGNFKFLGSCEDVFSILKMSDVFCLPSRSEGFSNALIEAMACGLPCVATDVGGNREALKDGETGFIVASEDWATMAARVSSLLDERTHAASMGLKGQEIVYNKFTAEAMMAALTGIYRSLLAGKGY